MKWIRIGDWVEALIHVITFGFGERLALVVARLFGKNSCGCCDRKLWLNRLTNPDLENNCGGINF